MMTISDAPAAWVGCLGCYNDGDLVGRWLNDADEIREYRCPRPKTIYNLHEELWVMDHENMPLISGECSPVEFAEAIEFVESLETWQPLGAVAAWLDNHHGRIGDVDLSEFDESYRGEWSTIEEYAEQYADDLGLIDANADWPMSYIDWGRAARDLVYGGDLWTAPAPGGIYVFTNY